MGIFKKGRHFQRSGIIRSKSCLGQADECFREDKPPLYESSPAPSVKMFFQNIFKMTTVVA